MPISNTKFVVLLEESKSICGLKLDAFQTTLGDGNTELNNLRTHAKNTYDAFANPKFAFVTFHFNETKIREFLVEISDVPLDNFSSFESQLETMLKFLEDTALKEAKVAADQLSTSLINAEILATISICATKITKRVNAFVAAGVNIIRDPQFLRRRRRHRKAKKEYRDKLKANLIHGTESDMLHIKNLGDLIALSTERMEFYQRYDRLTNFMESQINSPTSV